MSTVIEVVLPVFAVILLGFGFGRGGFLSAEGARGLGAFVYYAAIPALLFRGMAAASAGVGGSLGLLGAYFAGALAVFALSMAIGRLAFGLSLPEQGLMALGTGFSNSVQLGIPLVLAAFGDAGLVPLTIIISVHSLLLLSLTTVVVEAGRGHAGGALRMAEATAIAIAGNPVILSIVAGFLWRLTGFAVPAPLQHLIDLLAAAATPAALFSLGATLAGFRLAGDLAESLVVVAIKLLVLPVVVWLFATGIFHLGALDTAVATTCAALPTGSNAFILAQRYNLYVARAASSVLISTALSIVTLGVLLAVLATAR
ncbi:MAG TPA: AEC family transporter [Stellaceae bacterium]|jgi:malonate transporter|nr:AEC family transporter [Stellaceae bacterium]